MKKIITGDALVTLRGLPSESCDMCVTSPPYFGLRDYGVDGQIGLEKSPDEYVEKLVEVFREVRRLQRAAQNAISRISRSREDRNGSPERITGR